MKKLQSDFGTLTLALIPVAIVINVVVGQIAGNVLSLPIYLDSIGTVLVGVLAGPLAGALTGMLSNVVTTIVFGQPTDLPFAITATVIGLMAGLLAQAGWFVREPPRERALAAVALVGAALIVLQLAIGGLLGIVPAVVLTVLALALAWLRVFPALVLAGGMLTGIVSGIVSAPIVSFVFGGVTGSGTDLLVAIFRATGENSLQAALSQSLVSDPIDKFITYAVIFLILRALSPRLIGRFSRASNVLRKDQA